MEIHTRKPLPWCAVRVSMAAVAMLFATTLHHPARAAGSSGHVRAKDPKLEALIVEGSRRSGLFRLLRDRLDRSNVFVYVQHRVLPSGLTGRLSLLGVSHSWRYLRIEIECRLSTMAQIAALGHELQHAVEIADAASVVDPQSIRRLYGSIGFARDLDRQQFESDAALDAGFRVRRELQSAQK